jgi:hypothetical protein
MIEKGRRDGPPLRANWNRTPYSFEYIYLIPGVTYGRGLTYLAMNRGGNVSFGQVASLAKLRGMTTQVPVQVRVLAHSACNPCLFAL